MKSLKQRERVTRRMLGARLLWHDANGSRFVVYRRAFGVTRKTSMRYDTIAALQRAADRAQAVARRLKRCPARELAKFSFSAR